MNEGLIYAGVVALTIAVAGVVFGGRAGVSAFFGLMSGLGLYHLVNIALGAAPVPVSWAVLAGYAFACALILIAGRKSPAA